MDVEKDVNVFGARSRRCDQIFDAATCAAAREVRDGRLPEDPDLQEERDRFCKRDERFRRQEEV